MSTKQLEAITEQALESVSGGKHANQQLTTMLTQISSSIKELATSKPQSDPTQMMMMMMLGGGGGGGAAAAAPPTPPAQPNVVRVDVVGGRGRKGW